MEYHHGLLSNPNLFPTLSNSSQTLNHLFTQLRTVNMIQIYFAFQFLHRIAVKSLIVYMVNLDRDRYRSRLTNYLLYPFPIPVIGALYANLDNKCQIKWCV
jgi:hypothetical protein